MGTTIEFSIGIPFGISASVRCPTANNRRRSDSDSNEIDRLPPSHWCRSRCSRAVAEEMSPRRNKQRQLLVFQADLGFSRQTGQNLARSGLIRRSLPLLLYFGSKAGTGKSQDELVPHRPSIRTIPPCEEFTFQLDFISPPVRGIQPGYSGCMAVLRGFDC